MHSLVYTCPSRCRVGVLQQGSGHAQMTSQGRVRTLENDFGIRVISILFLVLILIIFATGAAEVGVWKSARLATNIGRRGSSHGRSPRGGSAHAGVGQRAGRSSGRQIWRLRASE